MEKLKDFVAVDFETLQAVTLRGTECLRMPIQIGMVKYKDGEPTGDSYSCFIKPPVAAPWRAYYTIGITSDDCNDARAFDEIYPEIVDFTNGLPLVAFSRTTEVDAFLEACAYYELENHFPKFRFIDPYGQCLSHYYHPTYKDEWQSGLAYWFGFFGLGENDYTPHQALDDAWMCAKLYMHLQSIDVDATLVRRPPNPGCFTAKGVKKDKTLFGEPIPEEEVQYPGNPLNRKYICLTGFACEVENALNQKLKQLGTGRHDNVLKPTDIVIPSRSYLEKEYDFAPTGKLAKAIGQGKQVMDVDELKEILLMLGMYDGELE